VEDGVRRCVVDAGLSLSDIDTVCFGLPGVVEHRTGKVRSSPVFRETDVNFAQEMTSRLNLPTIVESDAHAIALAHHWFGQARDLDDFVIVSLEQTLGLALLHNGQLFRGAGGLSHNLGDLVLGAASNETVRLSAIAGETAIFGNQQLDGHFAEAVRLGRGMAHAQPLVASDDHPLSVAAIRAGEAVGLAVANVVTLFGPPRVIIVGSTLSLGAVFVDSLRQSYALAIPRSIREVAELVFDGSPDEAWAQGAAIVALRELYESPWGTTGPASSL
jgi:predicted NBD/HSP70 family sugar kinase